MMHNDSMIDRFVLHKEESALLIIDIQEKLAAVMGMRDRVVKSVVNLIELAKIQAIPIIVTEQYPKGLGRTVPEIQEALPAYRPVEKIAFNCCSEPAFMEEIRKHSGKKIIVCGMETHICVLQTTLGLLKDGFIPHVSCDAVCSRSKQAWRAGTEFMRDAGAVITCTETVLFQLLGAAGTEEFKAVSRMVK